MTQMIFVNLPVTDLPRSRAFYESLGLAANPQFSNDQAACMVVSEQICVMLLRHEFWRTFTTRAIPDAHASAQVMLAVSRVDRQAVDDMVDAAARTGGKADPNPVQDLGFMYNRSFEDPDGHIWEAAFMDMSGVPDGQMPA